MTLSGEGISHADINLKLPRPGAKVSLRIDHTLMSKKGLKLDLQDLYHNTTIREDAPWRLQQVQDAGNHLQMAVTELGALDHDCEFRRG